MEPAGASARRRVEPAGVPSRRYAEMGVEQLSFFFFVSTCTADPNWKKNNTEISFTYFFKTHLNNVLLDQRIQKNQRKKCHYVLLVPFNHRNMHAPHWFLERREYLFKFAAGPTIVIYFFYNRPYLVILNSGANSMVGLKGAQVPLPPHK